ncbi:hypothetical protein M3Y97_00586700 [Aphelenchoides bicaudatus]|nr:hypothetical protein M3Y97_00586700 [Aphelenchoides bicaudatus]
MSIKSWMLLPKKSTMLALFRQRPLSVSIVQTATAYHEAKMKKHKRKKRYDRDFFIYQKYHAKKKAKAEAIFRQEMETMLTELRNFNPLEHVKDTIQKAKVEWKSSLAVSGRKKYPHWHELMSLEELYGIKPDIYIDKKAGRPSEEDEASLKEQREKYFKDFVRKEPANSANN